MRPERILFYSDMSPASDEAFSLALELARLHRSDRLYIVYVLHSPYQFRGDIIEPGLAMGINPEIMDVAEKSLRDQYEPALKGYRGASFHVLSGVEGVEILRFIRKHNVERVVMARAVAQRPLPKGSSSLEALLLERSPCPLVFAAPGRKKKPLSAEKDPTPEGRPRLAKVIHLERYRIQRGQRKCQQGMCR